MKEAKVLAALAAVGASTNHYELLAAAGIEREGTGIEQWAKKAQRALALLLHPDTCSKLYGFLVIGFLKVAST